MANEEISSVNPVDENQTCVSTGYQSVSVCVPVKVKPFANVVGTYTQCCGSPIVTSDSTPCGGTKKGTCTFTITQMLCITVPVEFGATAEVGDTYVNCLGASDEECEECEIS